MGTMGERFGDPDRHQKCQTWQGVISQQTYRRWDEHVNCQSFLRRIAKPVHPIVEIRMSPRLPECPKRFLFIGVESSC